MGKWTKGTVRRDRVVDRLVNLELYNRSLKPAANGCIEWTGITQRAGYGFIGFVYADDKTSDTGAKSGMMTAHRLAWMIEHNRLPTQRNINHTCHNKLCCNPEHLTEGTQQEKLKEMKLAGIHGGRESGSTGYAYNHKQHNRTYKYSEEEIQWHRTATSEDIAERYGINLQKAAAKRHQFRQGYTWLPAPAYEKMKTGPKPKGTK